MVSYHTIAAKVVIGPRQQSCHPVRYFIIPPFHHLLLSMCMALINMHVGMGVGCVCVWGGGGGGGQTSHALTQETLKQELLPFYIISYLVLPTCTGSLFFFKIFLGAVHKAKK